MEKTVLGDLDIIITSVKHCVGGGVMNILYCDKKSKCGNNRGTTIVLTNMMLPFSSVKYCAALVKLSG